MAAAVSVSQRREERVRSLNTPRQKGSLYQQPVTVSITEALSLGHRVTSLDTRAILLRNNDGGEVVLLVLVLVVCVCVGGRGGDLDLSVPLSPLSKVKPHKYKESCSTGATTTATTITTTIATTTRVPQEKLLCFTLLTIW